MGKSTPTPPPAPDPARLAAEQAQYNRINQFTPFGNLQFTNPGQEPGTPQTTQFLPGALSPQAQQLFPQQGGAKGSTGQDTPGAASGGGTGNVKGSSGQPPSPIAPGSGAFRGGGPGGFRLDSGQGGIQPRNNFGSNASASATLTLPPHLQALQNLRLTSDANLLSDAVGRQQSLNPNPIDLSQFGDIQSQLDTSVVPDVNLSTGEGAIPNIPSLNLQQSLNTGGLPGLSIPQLQQSVGGLDASGLPGLPQNANKFRDDVTSAVFERATGLLNPQFEQQERALRQRLASQGLPQQSEAANTELERFERTRNEALQNAALDATIRGGAEASRALGDQLALRGTGFGERQAQFGAGLQQGVFGNQAGLQQLAAQQGTRGQLFDEALTGGQFGNQAALQQFGAGFDQRNASIDDVLRGNDVQTQQFALGQQRLQNQLAQLNLTNAARSQGLNEQLGIRGNQFNELASLMGLQQVQPAQLSSFFGPGQVDTLGANQLAQNAQMARFQAQQQQSAAGLGGLFSLGSAALLGPIGGGLSSKLFGT